MKPMPLLLLALILSLPALAQKKIISPPEFPTGSPFSPGVLVGRTLYVSGQTGSDLKTNRLPANFQDEVRQALDRIGLVLKAAGMDYSDVVSATVYLTDFNLFDQMNQVYTSYFKTNRPARATVQVAGLARGSRVEIMVTASK